MKELDDRLFSSKLVSDLICGFGLIAPFHHYLRKARIQAQES
ncbi:MAG: hypothetical protein ACYTEL_23720 [Planctomycetota bacterium]|jgi:hypothetical protein